MNQPPKKDIGPIEYQDYLKIDQLLDCQKLKSEEYENKAHDEMLFIIVHQTYELWFKQILTELDSIRNIFQKEKMDERDMLVVTSRLHRIVEIQGVLVHQISVLETMTPLDFLEFRNYLYPASGFQSVQNRLIENKFGLRAGQRHTLNQTDYRRFIAKDYIPILEESEKEPSLFELLEKWLERTPFLSIKGFDFWKEYQSAVSKMLQNDKNITLKNQILSEKEKQRGLEEIEKTEKTFEALFDEQSYEKLRSEGHWHLSFKALHAALFINIYRDQPVLQQPFRILTALLDIDENFTTWRYRHALMAHRMLGRKIGTGGSSGHEYLKQATEKHKVFSDFFNLTTFFIPRSARPKLPKELQDKLSFHYTV